MPPKSGQTFSFKLLKLRAIFFEQAGSKFRNIYVIIVNLLPGFLMKIFIASHVLRSYDVDALSGPQHGFGSPN